MLRLFGGFEPIIQAVVWGAVLGTLLYMNWGERRVRRLYYLAAWFFAAVATMGKGPAGFGLPVLVGPRVRRNDEALGRAHALRARVGIARDPRRRDPLVRRERIDHSGNLPVGIELFISIGVLGAIADVDLMQRERKTGFLDHDESAAAVCRAPGVKLNH